MKSIIRFIFSDNCIISTLVILAFTLIPLIHCSPPCGLYGAPPCRFLPAPPGQTPACARPGKTYCEHVDNYPTYLIKHLVHKWGYEAKSLLVDETWDDFSSLNWPSTPVFYDPAFIFPHQQHFKQNHNDFTGYDYDTPPSVVSPLTNDGAFLLNKQQQQRTTPSPTFLYYNAANQRHNSNINQNNNNNQINNNNNNNSPYGINNGNHGHKVTPNNPTFWLKRIVRDLSQSASNHSIPFSMAKSKSQLSRDVSLNLDILEMMGVEKASAKRAGRVKRQSSGRSTLCQTTTQFVAPQAALNSKGNWMFVVNEASTAHQLVKAETCASNTCSNLCELPNGYNSRCEQKFAQKRLVALQANGQNLYTDTFWFPSCCVCTISSN